MFMNLFTYFIFTLITNTRIDIISDLKNAEP